MRMSLMERIPDFDHPVDLLDACHARILRMCETVVQIAAHVAQHEVDEDARIAARNVVRFFDTAGANHHRDEEHDLFPALYHGVPSAELNATRALLARLRAEHLHLDALWADMRARLPGVDAAHAQAFREAYRSHIDLEERELLPLARRVLGDEALTLLGGRMARRRGMPPSPSGAATRGCVRTAGGEAPLSRT